MRTTDDPVPPAPDHPVWLALRSYTVGPDAVALGFEARLARENGWSRRHAARVFDEYRRFAFLAAKAGHQVTPSDAVDQAWHLHLTYSRDYWVRFCPLLGRPLHHGPTAGCRAEEQRFFAQYAETLRRYEAVFGPPPADLWPPAAKRNARWLRLAPTRPEMPLAVAIFGTIVLAGSALEPLYRLRCGSNGGSIDASRGDSGCGGGGCGGCGG